MGAGIGAMVALQVGVALLAVVLLTRMGPAIGKILEENVYSGEAVEQMLAEVAAGSSREGFDDAFARAEANVTEPEEAPLLEAIASEREAAFSGDAAARGRMVTALRRLGAVNRASMTRADDEARRLGLAGAWAAALLSALALGLGVGVFRRLRARVELPIEAIQETTGAARAGNLQARAFVSDGPLELERIAADVNGILDAHMELERSKGQPEPEEADVASWRRLTAWALDRAGEPAVVLDAAGARVAASLSALEVDAPTDGPGWVAEEVEGTGWRLIRYVGGGEP